MKPEQKKMEYEKIKTDDFVTGEISDVLYDKDHVFKGYGNDDKGNKNPDTIQQAVRLVFAVDGYKYPHKTPWLKFSYSAKANLFKRFVQPLVDGAEEYMDFDLDQLRGVRVKMLWADKGEFQNIENIRPLNGKIVPVNESLVDLKAIVGEEEVPF